MRTAVDLADIGAAVEQRPGHRLLFFEREARGRRDPIGRSAAGQAAPARDRRRPPHRPARAFARSPARPASSGTGCPASITGMWRVGRPIAMAGDGNAVELARRQRCDIMPLRHLGHRARGLAGGEDYEPSAPRRFRQVRWQAPAGCAAATALRNRDSSNSRVGVDAALSLVFMTFRAGVWKDARRVSMFVPTFSRSAAENDHGYLMRKAAWNSKPPSIAAWSSICARAPMCRIST